MTMNNPLANMMSKILNAERVGKKECVIKPYSRVIQAVLDVMKEQMYVGEYAKTDDGKGGFLTLSLLTKINKCGAITPRHAVKKDNFEKYEKRYLPAKNIGVLIVSTPKGVMTHGQAKEQNLGGRLIAYCY